MLQIVEACENHNDGPARLATRWRFISLVVLIFVLTKAAAIQAQTKFVRLRNEIIATKPNLESAGTLRAASSESKLSGLFLVQLKEPLKAGWAEQLRDLSVELLRPVPDDAYVARLDSVPMSQLRALPFLFWVGEYRPGFKVQSKLRPFMDPTRDSGRFRVNVLLAAKASPLETTRVRRMFLAPEGESVSRFGTVLRGSVSSAELIALSQSPSVLWIEPGTEFAPDDEVASRIVAGGPLGATANSHTTATQQMGFDGSGVTVAVADSGLSDGTGVNVHPDLRGRVDAFYFYGGLTDAIDQHGHGTHIAGIIAGDGATGEVDENGALYGLGVAPKAHLVAQRVFDGVGRYQEPSSFEKLTRDAIRAGAVIGSHSWGDDTQGRYDLNAMEFDALVRDADGQTAGDQPYVIVFSAGNAGPGPQTVGTPAVAKNVIAVGASQNDRRTFPLYNDGLDAMADLSSRGPCEDGRIKPDLVAPGTWIASLQSAAAGDRNAWQPISANYAYFGGTSQSSAEVSGAAAVFVQYYRLLHTNATPSPALVKAALINSATDMKDEYGTGPVPNNDEGWGRLNLASLIGSGRSFDFLDQSVLLATGQTYEKRIVVASSGQPLKITLAYTDVPALPAAIPALLNDLDLEVLAPDGRVFRGNNFYNGESTDGAADWDRVNNVEAVHLKKPAPGEYLIRVRAAKVMEDSRIGTPAVDQDFALVVSGDLPRAGAGVMILDRAAYTAPDLIQLKLIDSDLKGRTSLTTQVTSASEPTGKLVVMRSSGSFGVFTGALATVSGPVGDDSRLRIRDGDRITAIYQDASPPGERRATALADLRRPELTGVSTTNRYGKTIVSWKTDEPATSVVWYGTNRNLTLSVTNKTLVQLHQIALESLRSGATYSFLVTSADEAGNIATNNNSGALYEVVARSAATVLLVNAYKTDDFSPAIPLSSYTDALDQTGVSYDVWDVERSGSPGAADLRPYRIVMWRLSDSLFDGTTLTLVQQTVIQEYLNGGGAFFMASMEILSRLGDVPFRANVLQVQKFASKPFQFGKCDQCDEDVGVPSILGSDTDPVTSGIDIGLDYSNFAAIREIGIGPDLGDTFTPTTDGASILVNPANGKTVGVRYPRTGDDTSGRIVFLSFPLDAVPMTGPPPNTRADLLRRVFGFLAPGVSDLASIALDKSTYPVPGKVTIEVTDADLSKNGEGIARVFTDSSTNGLVVKLVETTRRGLFRGTVTLVPATTFVPDGQLPAKGGDALRAEYFDESAKSVMRTAAKIDTIPPRISDVAISTEFEAAWVTWTTTELSDALVQFGESTLLGRTAYRVELEKTHRMHLVGLKPDRVYYFQVASRDAAGNNTVDANRGLFYSFRTLKPLVGTWSDNLDQSRTNWTVINGDNSGASWRLGVPANGRETNAHSPPNAWGSNLQGDFINSVDTRLISPAVALTGGSRATLTFWHSYDFTPKSDFDIYESGRVYVSTNNAATWNPIAEFTGASDGWVKSEINLTPYLGRVVQISWTYGLLSLEARSRPGWLLDDVAITLTSPLTGTIQITNNLSQASVILTGPVSISGDGLEVVLANAPPGQYVVSFLPVPYYQTPVPQTNSLAANGTLVFQGNYTYFDANENSIPDPWELQYFGGVFANRTRTIDTDQDGFSDLAEFICGTNPLDRNSKIQMTRITPLPDGTVRLTWRSVFGHGYRVVLSTNGSVWSPVSGWIRATGSETSQIVPGFSGFAPYFYRLEVRP